MLESLSTSPWKWTWRFLLLACVSVALFAVGAFINPESSTTAGAIWFLIGLACVAGLAVGIVGAAVTLVMTLRRRHSPPAKPMT